MEYTIVIGTVVLIIFAMSTMVKRGTQGMIKVVADQIGVQENAEQSFDDTGHLVNSYTSTRTTGDKTRIEFNTTVSYIFGDVTISESTTVVNLGFSNDI